MSPPHMSLVITNTSCLTLMLFAVHRADTSITCQVLYEGHSGYSASKPTALYCIGKGDSGNWTKIENGTEHPIARFNRSSIDLQDSGYGITVFTRKGNNSLETLLNLTHGDNGRFTCTIGNDTEVLYVPMLIKAGGSWHGHNVSLQCMPINKNVSDPDHIENHPYNITWFLNSTIVGWSHIQNDSYFNVTYNTNSSFVRLKNVTIRSNWIHTNTTGPVCVTCLLGENGQFGSTTLCSPNTKDMSASRLTITDALGEHSYVALKWDKNDNEHPITFPVDGSITIIGSVLVVCAVSGIFFFIHFKRKRRLNTQPPRRIYRSLDFRFVDIDE